MIGKTLVHYEISAEIGRGGMGEVYQAKDTKLGRDVAIKVLPEEFALDTDRVARFQREAKLLASLNHPNIAAIYGLEESDDTHFLVMELIEGQTLNDRIKSGPIPAEEALKLALQIAEALEAAHENGVIHRDLKPANIKVTPDGKVKILDFGLAKAYAGDQGNVGLADSPTISAAATQQGVILGTAAYMSPEQARGKPVDKRADIWAFGCVLFEMLTGKAAFQGEDVTEILAAVVKSEVNLDLLPEHIHPRVCEVLTRSLQKEKKKRYGGIGEAQYEIEQAITDPSGIFVQPSVIAKPKKKLHVGIPWIGVTAVLCLIIAGVAVWKLKPPEPRKVMRFSYELPESQQFILGNIQFAFSPDGSQFVYLTTDGFYLRSVDAFDARHVAGTDQNSRQPVFSPDGKWVGYWSSNDRKLKKIAISGGVPVGLCDTSTFVGGLSWGLDNTIVYTDVGGGIKRVSADGGTPESIIEADLANMRTDGLPVFPQMLPDGKTLLFTNIFSITDFADSQITVQSLESGEREVLVGGFAAMYLSSGHLVFSQVNNSIESLVAVPFDLDTMKVKGGPVPLLESIRARALSDSGTLVYVPGTSGSGSASSRTLVWVDKEGNEEQIEAEPDAYRLPKLSPDGSKVVLVITDGTNPDIWIWDIVRETMTRLTFFERQDIQPIWTPDGNRIVFFSAREEGGVYWKNADGTGEAEFLGSVPDRQLFPWCFSKDGSTLLNCEFFGANMDIGMLLMEGDHEHKPLLTEEYVVMQPKISPDGRWMAYTARESDEWEVYVRPFPDVNEGKWQVSTDSGIGPLWSPDSNELFYRGPDGIMVVPVDTEPTFKLGKPKVLFPDTYINLFGGGFEGHAWDIHPDGKRFIMMKSVGTEGDESVAEIPRKINIILNWDEELKERVPVD